MHWITRVSGVISLAMATIVLSPSLQSLPQTEAIRSSSQQQPLPPISVPPSSSSFRTSPTFLNSPDCPSSSSSSSSSLCHPSTVHVAITLDSSYLRGSIAAVHSVLHHSNCPQSLFFHFLVDSDSTLHSLVRSTFPHLLFKLYYFDPFLVRPLISTSVRHALEHPLNYARNYLAHLLEPCVRRVIYLDSDLVLVDDISKLWLTDLHGLTIGAPQYCHANFTKYFSPSFWNHPRYSGVFSRRNPCYFNTGVMVMDLARWRRGGYTARIEKWMQIQKAERIYELGSLPPFLLVFAGHVASIDHRWNQHGLGGDNVKGSCRDLHAGPVSLLHWSGSGKPWIRLDSRRPCPLDYLWSPYDLFGQRR